MKMINTDAAILDLYELEVKENKLEKEQFNQIAVHDKSDIPANVSRNLFDTTSFMERNLEKWNQLLFPCSDHPEINKSRTHELGELARGIEARITVVPSQEHSAPDAYSYDVLCALTEIWCERGMPQSPFATSIAEIATKMGYNYGKKSTKTSGKTISAIRTHLNKLYDTKTKWDMSYEVEKQQFENVKQMRFLSIFDYTTEDDRADSDKFKKTVLIKFDEKIIASFNSGNLIPVNTQVRREIRSDQGKILYSYLDRTISGLYHHRRSDFRQFSIKSKNVIKVIGLNHIGRFKHKSRRKELLYRMVKLLDGKEMSCGAILKLAISESADRGDYILIASMEDLISSNSYTHTMPIVNDNDEQVSALVDDIEKVIECNADIAIKKIAMYYDINLVRRAISEAKSIFDTPSNNIRLKIAFFKNIVHRLAHQTGAMWIKPCDIDCPLRSGEDVKYIK